LTLTTDVAHFRARLVRRTFGIDVRQNDAPIAFQSEPDGECRSDALRMYPDLPAMHVAVFADLLDDRVNDTTGNRESDAFASAGLRQDERVDAHNTAICIKQRSAAISRIDGRVGLDINHRIVRLELPGNGADNPHRDRVGQTQRVAESQYELSLAQRFRVSKLEKRQSGTFDFQNGEIAFAIDAHNLCVEPFAGRAEHGVAVGLID
jgi:hypothetical protein